MRGASDLTTGPLSIGNFVNLIRQTVKQDRLFQNQAIKGEVSQWKQYPSGHTYFTLRDNVGQMSAVIWQGRCSIDPSIKEGSEVVVIAGVDLYAKQGRIQLVVDKIEPVNAIGKLEEALRKLKLKLRQEGVFDRPRNQLPLIPKHIAIVTGTGSAALSDMNRLIENRWPGLRRTIIGVLVQGENSVQEIVRGLAVARKLSDPEVANKRNQPPVDVIIVGRGGGSPEDLWSFNLEPVARAIIASKIPVISAVGHESDLLISDMVADIRASTPSNAIERCVPDYNSIQMQLSDYNERIDGATIRQFSDVRNRLKLLASMLKAAPMAGINNAKIKIQNLTMRLNNSSQSIISQEKSRIAKFEASLNAVHPQRVLERGYSMIQNDEGEVLSKIEQLSIGQNIKMNFADGKAEASIVNLDKRKR
ncbi:MAG: exodeoxyribonuclease VII large subunit [Euryarchaeota archaeon]|jgi:exodeoxyribonuclease VII large subunit|nr:exodeoxyribonuclease VII large subunit [Euryarchaeota archaeon]MBT4925075.1 exodeoxyribonuclease VII large subunit [Euryarchaeota archaeon]MBT5735279.1 exodeoxyribonuclease VII large subunit [Euryarchaeota archaeon]